MLQGKIIKGIGGFYYVDTENGVYECRARGIFRKDKITPLVGDRVKISIVDEESKKGVVEEIDKRDTELMRSQRAGGNSLPPGFLLVTLKQSLTLAHGVVLGPEGDMGAKELPAGPILGA